MPELTANEADRIIQAHIEVSGATSDTMVSAWQAIVYAIVERLDLGAYRPACVRLLRDVIFLWSKLQPSLTEDGDYKYVYLAHEVDQVRSTLLELNRLAVAVLMAYPDLPQRSAEESERTVLRINEIALFVRSRLETFEAVLARGGSTAGITVTAREFGGMIDRCQVLIAVILGPEYSERFRAQYDACVPSWFQVVGLLSVPDTTKGN